MATIKKSHCIIIPAIKRPSAIPDQFLKKLAGRPLVEYALDIARGCVPGEDILVLTESEEIALLCERRGTRTDLSPDFNRESPHLATTIRSRLEYLATAYENCVVLNPACPLLTWIDVEKATAKFHNCKADLLISVRKERQRLWHPREQGSQLIHELVESAEPAKLFFIETNALNIFRLESLAKGKDKREKLRTVPFFLNERNLEIRSYQDWWICEKLLERRHVVFVIAGYPAIGLGHVYRALMFAHEISSHRVSFVCTKESELAVERIASRDYEVIRQEQESLERTVLAMRPDLVINDFLDTRADYIRTLQAHDCRCVNFEDEGSGAQIADLVINALDNSGKSSARKRCGPEYFCLRDEFVNAARNIFREKVQTVLLTFGGTDQLDTTSRILDIIEPICRCLDIRIRIITGPGYAHKERLEAKIRQLDNPLLLFSWATNIISKMMEGADLAICSSGRTVYELAHMRVPGIVLATHEREGRHNFARPRNGFVFLGLMREVSDLRIRNTFLAMLKVRKRAIFWERQNKLNFVGNKERVVGLIQDQLEKSRFPS